MPIRINLLAEAQAAEESRRRDPVKRFAKVAACFIIMVLVWSASLQVQIMAQKSQLNNREAARNRLTNDYAGVLVDQRKLADVNGKLAALNHLATERILKANMLDTLLHSTVDGIQITKLHTDESFNVTTEVKPEKGPIKPATSTQKIRLFLDARDNSANPGNQQITKFKETLSKTPYFIAQHISLDNISLKNLSTPQVDAESGKSFVMFTVECVYPEITR